VNKVTNIHLPSWTCNLDGRRLRITDYVWVHKFQGRLYLIHEEKKVKIAEWIENVSDKDAEIYTWAVKKLSERVSAVKKTISRLNEEKHVACKELDLLTGIQKSIGG